MSMRSQRGVALFVVLIAVLVAMLMALWASKTAFFNEMVVGNDADYQRTFEAAQALLQDAELDITGKSAYGKDCQPVAGNPDICRWRYSNPEGQSQIAQIPLEVAEVRPLLNQLRLQTSSGWCKEGLCTKRISRQDFWNFLNQGSLNAIIGEVPFKNMFVQAAQYGQYTGAKAAGNPILNKRCSLKRGSTNQFEGACYWIEVMRYDQSSNKSNIVLPETQTGHSKLNLNLVTPNLLYRVTAVAYGLKPNTMVVLQQTVAPIKLRD